MMIEELFVDSKSTVENFKVFNTVVLESGIFNWKIYDEMKSIAKFKFLHIGLSIA